MNFIPGQDRITEEVVELFGLVNARYVSIGQEHLETRRYLSKALEDQAERLIIEKLLSVSIKLRYLDEKVELLKHDRCNSGQVTKYKDEEPQKTEIGLREALNKIIHSDNIEIKAAKSAFKVEKKPSSFSDRELLLKEGTSVGFSIFVRIEGSHNDAKWVFQTELTHLINEMLRVLHFQNVEIPL